MTPPPPDAHLLEALLNDAQDAHARLLALLEHTLQADLDSDAQQALAFQPQIEALMAEAGARLDALQAHILPWPERRRLYPAELAARVDRYLELLLKGLRGLQAQLDRRMGDLEERRRELRQALEQLDRQRKGLKGYKQKDLGVDFFRGKA